MFGRKARILANKLCLDLVPKSLHLLTRVFRKRRTQSPRFYEGVMNALNITLTSDPEDMRSPTAENSCFRQPPSRLP